VWGRSWGAPGTDREGEAAAADLTATGGN